MASNDPNTGEESLSNGQDLNRDEHNTKVPLDTCKVDDSSMTIGESAARDLKKRRTKENRTPEFEETHSIQLISPRYPVVGEPISGGTYKETHG